MPVNPRNKQGIVSVDIYRPVYDRISKLAEKQKITIKDYVNQLLEAHASTVDFATKRFSEISQAGSTDTSILMEDKGKKLVASITVQIENGNMWCSACKKNFCEHIFRSLLSPDWIKVMKNLGKQEHGRK